MRKYAALTTYLSLCLGLAAAYFLIVPTPTTKLLLYNSVGLLSVGAVVFSLARYRPLADFPGSCSQRAHVVPRPTSSTTCWRRTRPSPLPVDRRCVLPADVPLVGVGLGLKIRNRSQGDAIASLIDAGIFGIAVFSILWVVVMDSCQPDGQQPVLAGGRSRSSSRRRHRRALHGGSPRRVDQPAPLGVVAHRCVALHAGHGRRQYGVLSAADNFEPAATSTPSGCALRPVRLAALVQTPSDEPPQLVSHQRLTNGRLALMFVATVTVPIVDLVFGTARTAGHAHQCRDPVRPRAGPGLGPVRIVERGQNSSEEARRDR